MHLAQLLLKSLAQGRLGALTLANILADTFTACHSLAEFEQTFPYPFGLPRGVEKALPELNAFIGELLSISAAARRREVFGWDDRQAQFNELDDGRTRLTKLLAQLNVFGPRTAKRWEEPIVEWIAVITTEQAALMTG